LEEIMDKQLRYAKIFKALYPLVHKPKILGLTKYSTIARLLEKKFLEPDDKGICLPQERAIPIDKELDNPVEIVPPVQVIDYFIDKSSHIAHMNYCMCRSSNNCKDYSHTDHSCLFLGEAAKDIHPDLCQTITKEEAKKHIRRCREAGLMSLIAKAKFDAMWLGVNPGDKLLTICSCCPCCCISVALPRVGKPLKKTFGRAFAKMPGVDISVTEACVGCGKCVEACMFGGVTLEGDMAVLNEECRACGRCAEICPSKALQLSLDDDYVKDAIDLLSPIVDVT
jgi:ferredoxin